MIRVDTRPRKRNAPRPAEKEARGFRKWVLGRGCLLVNHRQGGCGPMPGRKPVEPAHIDCAGGKGMGTKVADKYVLPLCPKHHDEQHGRIGPFRQRGGWKTFQLKYGFNAVQEADRLWHLWPGRIAWEKRNAE